MEQWKPAPGLIRLPLEPERLTLKSFGLTMGPLRHTLDSWRLMMESYRRPKLTLESWLPLESWKLTLKADPGLGNALPRIQGGSLLSQVKKRIVMEAYFLFAL